MDKAILNRLTILGHPHRMAVFRLLVRRYPDRLPAGEIGRALDLKPSTLSVYLAALCAAGLITQDRKGTSLRYRAEMSAAQGMVDYLFLDCCRGRPELCGPDLQAASPAKPDISGRKMNALFICTGNSARSVFAEAILRKEAGNVFFAFSAGTHPNSQLNPTTVAVLRANGHDPSALRPKHVSEFQHDTAPAMDFVITVCDQAANEECPAWHGQPINAHWGVPDPVKSQGSEAEKRQAFQQAYDQLRQQILTFAALPFHALGRASLQARVDDIKSLENG